MKKCLSRQDSISKKSCLQISEAENNTSGLLSRGGIADLPIRQKLRKASLWELLHFFFLAFATFIASRTL